MSKIPHDERVLNDEQKVAVEYGSGPILIIAGAGTGKTTVITERIKHLISSGFAKPSEILALTFTEKAAREMEERVDQMMPYGYTQMWIATFHSFCERILKSEAIHIGLNPGFRLLSEADATMIMRKNLFSFDIQYFRPLGNPTKFIAGMLQHFSRLKDEDVTPEQYLAYVQEKVKSQKSKVKTEEKDLELQKLQELAAVYKQYEELKVKEGVMDFADLISNTLKLFRTRPNILTNYRKQFKFILVDEFQDTNVAQYELIKLLAPSKQKPNLTIVGDDNQAIYKFRGAAVSNILSFQKDYPTAQQVVLTANYRSLQFILDASYQLIKHNDPDTLEASLGISKQLVSTRGKNGGEVQFFHEDRVENEADAVVKEVKRQKAKGKSLKWSDVAILVRANNHAEPFIRAFARHGIPVQFLGPGRLFAKEEIKELISYLQVLLNWQDSMALLKVLSMRYFDIAPRDLVTLSNVAKRSMASLLEVCEWIIGSKQTVEKLPEVNPETRATLQTIIPMMERHINLVYKETAGQILYYFLQDSGLLPKILDYQYPLDEQKANNITKFFSKLKDYEAQHEDASVTAVLDWILLAMELGESPLATDTDWTENNAVNILTVHSAKGLEFPIVFLVNLVAQRFPTNERREQIPIPEELIKETLPIGDFHLEEERRLFYVGMTRARDRLYFTASNFYGEGKREKKLSPFVAEVLGEQAIGKAKQKPVDQMSLFEWNTNTTKDSEPKTKNANNIKVTYLSYSQIETFRTCPLHYKLAYILKLPITPSPALSFGSTMHTALRHAYEMVQQGKSVSKETLITLLEDNWLRDGYENKRYETEMKKRGEEYLSGYFEKEFSPKTKVLTLEQSFVIPLRSPDRFLRAGGRIDRVDDLGGGRIEIIDYKTGRIPTKREVDANLQLSMYALAATEIPDKPFGRKSEEVTLTLYYFDTQEKISTTRTREQLAQEKQNILQIAADIEQSDFRCSGNMLCSNCEYKMFCGVE